MNTGMYAKVRVFSDPYQHRVERSYEHGHVR